MFRMLNAVRFIVERPGKEDLEYERRWVFSELPKVGDHIEVERLNVTGEVMKVVRAGAKLTKVFVKPD